MQLTRLLRLALLSWLLGFGPALAERIVVYDGQGEVEVGSTTRVDSLLEIRVHGGRAMSRATEFWLLGQTYEIGPRLRDLVVQPLLVPFVRLPAGDRAGPLTLVPFDPMPPGHYRPLEADGRTSHHDTLHVGLRAIGDQLVEEAELSLEAGRRMEALALMNAAMENGRTTEDMPGAFHGLLELSRIRESVGRIRLIATAVESFSIDHDHYPKARGTTDVLVDLLSPTYIRRLPLRDAWEQSVDYWSDGLTYLVVSRGADGRADAQSHQGEHRSDPDSDDIVFDSGSFRSSKAMTMAWDELESAAERVEALLGGERGRRDYTLPRFEEVVRELEEMRESNPLPIAARPTTVQSALGWPVVDVHGRAFLYRSDGHAFQLIALAPDGSRKDLARWPIIETGRGLVFECRCESSGSRSRCGVHD